MTIRFVAIAALVLRHSRTYGLMVGGMGPPDESGPGFVRVHSGSDTVKPSLAHATGNFKCVAVLVFCERAASA